MMIMVVVVDIIVGQQCLPVSPCERDDTNRRETMGRLLALAGSELRQPTTSILAGNVLLPQSGLARQ